MRPCRFSKQSFIIDSNGVRCWSAIIAPTALPFINLNHGTHLSSFEWNSNNGMFSPAITFITSIDPHIVKDLRNYCGGLIWSRSSQVKRSDLLLPILVMEAPAGLQNRSVTLDLSRHGTRCGNKSLGHPAALSQDTRIKCSPSRCHSGTINLKFIQILESSQSDMKFSESWISVFYRRLASHDFDTSFQYILLILWLLTRK